MAGITYAIESSLNPGPPWARRMLPSGTTIIATGALVEASTVLSERPSGSSGSSSEMSARALGQFEKGNSFTFALTKPRVVRQ